VIESQQIRQSAIKHEIEVQEPGRVEISGPFTPGAHLIVFVIQEDLRDDAFADFVAASASSTAFWDNTLDDEELETSHEPTAA
jgi:hypothetical protein